MASTLGTRLKYFRKRAGLSQFQLEIDTVSSPGSVSRIESGETNPNKETLTNLADGLKLNPKERSYLFGNFARQASREEIEAAKAEVANEFRRTDFYGYLVDETHVLLDASAGMEKLLHPYALKNSPSVDKSKVIGKTIYELVTDPQYGIVQLINRNEDEYYNFLKEQVLIFLRESSFMLEYEGIKRSLDAIKSNPLALKAWEEIDKEKPSIYNPNFTSFNMYLGNFKVRMEYKSEKLLSNDRFEVIIYKPKNIFLKIINMFG